MNTLAQNRERALTANGDELTVLIYHQDPAVLLSLLDNPALDETHLGMLLDRQHLPKEVLEEVYSRKPLLKNYRLKRALAFHPGISRLASLRLVRDLYLMDLAQLALLPGTPAELKRIAEDQLLTRLTQLPRSEEHTS